MMSIGINTGTDNHIETPFVTTMIIMILRVKIIITRRIKIIFVSMYLCMYSVKIVILSRTVFEHVLPIFFVNTYRCE
jgi:hypothetical protein